MKKLLLAIVALASFDAAAVPLDEMTGRCRGVLNTGTTYITDDVTAAECQAWGLADGYLGYQSYAFTSCGNPPSGTGASGLVYECRWDAFNGSGILRGSLRFGVYELPDPPWDGSDPAAPPPVDCTAEEGQLRYSTVLDQDSVIAAQGTNIVFDDGCVGLVESGFCAGEDCILSVLMDGTNDTPSNTPGEVGPCVITAGNDEYCSPAGDQPPSQTNCGTFNGQDVCLDSTPDGVCWFDSAGGYVCGEGAPTTTPPLPDNGTPGQVAQPDVTVIHNTNSYGSSSTSFYSAATVGGSSTTVNNTYGGIGAGDNGQVAVVNEVDVNIDESGTPTGIDDSAAGISTDPSEYGVTEYDGAGDDWLILPSEIDGGTCTDLTWNWAGNVVTLDLCSWWLPVREWVGWLNAVFVLFWSYFRISRALGGTD